MWPLIAFSWRQKAVNQKKKHSMYFPWLGVSAVAADGSAAGNRLSLFSVADLAAEAALGDQERGRREVSRLGVVSGHAATRPNLRATRIATNDRGQRRLHLLLDVRIRSPPWESSRRLAASLDPALRHRNCLYEVRKPAVSQCRWQSLSACSGHEHIWR